MVQKIFFQSSLPRAGSTLLQNVMGQNPDFYVTPTSGVLELVYAARANYTSSPEFKAQDSQQMKQGFLNFCNQGVQGFFNAITDKPYVLDKSRGWGIHYGFLNSFYPNPKVICMVRDLRGIFGSMEKNFRKNPDKDANIINTIELKNMTTTSRIDHFSVAPPIGPSLEWLSETFQRGQNNDILFIRFEDLTTDPETEVKKIYNYLKLPHFNHDFNNVQQLTQENDVIHGIFGDHKIKPKVEPIKNDYVEILGQENCDRLKQHYDWYFRIFNYI